MERDDIYSLPPGKPGSGKPRSRFVRRRDRFAGLLLLMALLVGIGVQVYPRVRGHWQQYQHHRLLQAVDRGDAQAVRSLVQAYPWLVRARGPSEESLLARALLAGHDDVAKPLRQAGAMPVLIVEVVDAATQKPLSNVDVRMRLDGQSNEIHTGASSPYVLELPEKPARFVSLRAAREGYVSTTWSYRLAGRRAGFGRESLEMPDRIVLPLEPAHTIGGVVRNEQGEPVAGATLSLWLRVPMPGAEQGLSQFVRDLVATNSQGEWTSTGWPARIARLPEIRLSHPDYVDAILPAQEMPDAESLLTNQAVLIARRGLNLAGKVVDEQGQPVADAVVIYSSGSWQSHRNVLTDGNGLFELKGLALRPEVFTIRADGFAPRVLELTPSKAGEPVQITLQRGRHLHGRVQDVVGLPISGAIIRLVSWPGQHQLAWQTHTDALGTFSWSNAPHEPMTLEVAAEGYMSVRPTVDGSQNDPLVVTMAPYMLVKATVTDAATRLPIEGYEVMWGHAEEAGEVRWQPRSRQQIGQGTYRQRLVDWQAGYQLRVSARGYHTIESPVLEPGQREVELELALEPMEPGWRGRIELPNGQPAEAALVYSFGSAPTGTTITSDGLSGRGVRPADRTTSQGDVTLYGDGISRVVVLHEQGFAYHHLDTDPQVAAIRLEPWVRLEGQAIRDGQPLVDQNLLLDVSREPSRQGRFRLTVRTDGDGRFVVDRLPAGNVEILHSDRMENRSYTPRIHRLSVQAGQHVQVQFGGQGVPVGGRIDLGQVQVDAVAYRLSMRSRDRADHLTVWVESDGRFQFDAVTPGRYDLYLYVDVADGNGGVMTRRSERKTITIADDAGQVVELATLVMPVAAR